MKAKIVFGEYGKPDRYYLDGEEVSKKRFYKAQPPVLQESGVGLIGWKPIASDGAGVHPDQIPEAEAHAKAMGVPTEFLPNGCPVFTSRSHRKAYLHAHHFHDNQGGYGD